MRLFLGVAIPDDVIKQIRTATQTLKEKHPEYRWIPEKNYHISVFFFGERTEEKVPDMIEGLEQTLFDIDQSVLSTRAIEMFVKKDINLHIKYGRSRELEIIHDRIISVVGPQTPQKHTTYIPHTTLAKFKLPSKQQYFHLKKILKNIDIDAEFGLNQLHLYQSVIEKPFPEYRILHTFQLQ